MANEDSNKNFEITEEKPDHHYRTEIPNIIFEILSGNDFIVYCFLKRICGDTGKCWMSVENLAKKIGISENNLRKCIKNINSVIAPLKFSLIKITERVKPDGGNDTNVIEIRDVWRVNGDFFREKNRQKGGANPEGGGVQILKGGGANFEPKEEPSQEGVVVVMRESASEEPKKQPCLVKSDVYRIGLKKEWSPQEIEDAWYAFEKCKTPLTDPVAYIEGIINKKRILNEHKQNKEVACPTKNTYHKSKKQEPGKNEFRIPNQNSLEKDTGELASQQSSSDLVLQFFKPLCERRGTF